MGKRIRFTVTDVATGPGWAVVLLHDNEEQEWVASWDGSRRAGRWEGKDGSAAVRFFNGARRMFEREEARA